MSYQQTWEERPNRIGLDERVAVLSDARGARFEIWPALGMTAIRWRSSTGAEILYASPTLFDENKPTRTGIPVLFPFPNRIRAGHFRWDNHDYQLPLQDPTGKNAIHGFACYRPWRIVDAGADSQSAWLTGEFQISQDAPHASSLWHTDARIRLTYRLQHDRVYIESSIENPTSISLPFGLGYHPYFALAPFGGDSALISAPAEKYWELEANLPTGRRLAVDADRDLRSPRSFAKLKLDDVLTDLHPPRQLGKLGLLGEVRHPSGDIALSLWGDSSFREIVAFTPPHRQAICLEPYTCTTDAINLQAQGLDAGLQILAPGGTWQSTLLFQFNRGT